MADPVLMPTFFIILQTLLGIANSSCFKCLYITSITLSFLRCLQFWKEEKICEVWIRCLRWLRHTYGFVFGQKLTHRHCCVSWCVIMVQNPWLVFSVRFWRIASHNRYITPRKYSFVTVQPCGKNLWCTMPLQSKKTLSKTFTFDRTWRAFLDIGSSGRFNWDDWTMVAMS